MDNKKMFSLVNWITIFVVFAVSIYIIVMLRSEANECLEQPMLYGLKLANRENSAYISCTCRANDNEKVLPVIITADNITPIVQQGSGSKSSLYNFNYSNLHFNLTAVNG